MSTKDVDGRVLPPADAVRMRVTTSWLCMEVMRRYRHLTGVYPSSVTVGTT